MVYLSSFPKNRVVTEKVKGWKMFYNSNKYYICQGKFNLLK